MIWMSVPLGTISTASKPCTWFRLLSWADLVSVNVMSCMSNVSEWRHAFAKVDIVQLLTICCCHCEVITVSWRSQAVLCEVQWKFKGMLRNGPAECMAVKVSNSSVNTADSECFNVPVGMTLTNRCWYGLDYREFPEVITRIMQFVSRLEFTQLIDYDVTRLRRRTNCHHYLHCNHYHCLLFLRENCCPLNHYERMCL